MWFAWKIVPLRYTKQLDVYFCLCYQCCDLLEKSYLCGIQNNFLVIKCYIIFVVICLKNRTFAVYKTTPPRNSTNPLVLWFAWKIVPLRYTKQHVHYQHSHRCRCDLLEKSYLCGIQNNSSERNKARHPVVICLKNRTFAVYKTTTNTSACSKGELWFAWKIVPLRYTKQLPI